MEAGGHRLPGWPDPILDERLRHEQRACSAHTMLMHAHARFAGGPSGRGPVADTFHVRAMRRNPAVPLRRPWPRARMRRASWRRRGGAQSVAALRSASKSMAQYAARIEAACSRGVTQTPCTANKLCTANTVHVSRAVHVMPSLLCTYHMPCTCHASAMHMPYACHVQPCMPG